MERRFTSNARCGVQQRAEGGTTITGYAAVFYSPENPGTEYRIWDDYRERIAPTAFDRALREQQDVRAFFNHDPSAILGRVSAGTLRLSVDTVGLRYEIDLPDTTIGSDVAASIARGDVTGASYMFVRKGSFTEDTESGIVVTITDVDLYEVGPVTFPAYTATTAELRAKEPPELVAYRRAKADRLAKAKAALCRLSIPE